MVGPRLVSPRKASGRGQARAAERTLPQGGAPSTALRWAEFPRDPEGVLEKGEFGNACLFPLCNCKPSGPLKFDPLEARCVCRPFHADEVALLSEPARSRGQHVYTYMYYTYIHIYLRLSLSLALYVYIYIYTHILDDYLYLWRVIGR